jgi:hypothetical protein
LPFKSAGAYSIRQVQENQQGLKFPQKYQFQMDAHVNLLGEHTTTKKKELLVRSGSKYWERLSTGSRLVIRQ